MKIISIKSSTVTLTAALALAATPALAERPEGKGQGKPETTGQSTAPGQICRKESRKKTDHGKGKSPFAACVTGVKRADAEAAKQTTEPKTKTAPGRLCKDQSRKKDADDKKSPFAACVTGATKAQRS
jgi:hypothetical protein